MIYALVDPLTERVRYVGLTTRGMKRPREHFCGDGFNRAKSAWIRELAELGLRPVVAILQECETDELRAAERAWIAFFRPEGLLLNALDSAGPPSDEARAKMRAVKLGKKMSVDSRAKLSAARMGIRPDAEARKKMSEAKRGKAQTPERVHRRAVVMRVRKLVDVVEKVLKEFFT